eukprot:jgi/Chlat1/4789/Chrsp31S04777
MAAAAARGATVAVAAADAVARAASLRVACRSPLPIRLQAAKPQQLLWSAAGRRGAWRAVALRPPSSSSTLRSVQATAVSMPASPSSSSSPSLSLKKEDIVQEDNPENNVPESIFAKIGANLHRQDNHPLGIIKNAIHAYFDKAFEGQKFEKFDDLLPIVSTIANFDDVLVPADHVSRGYNDTYYVDGRTVLRCHTSAHQAELLRAGHTRFLVTGDVYRRDSIDATHYPVFHQMEGVRVFNPSEWEAAGTPPVELAAAELKSTLEGLARHLFGDVDMRWVDTYFPFTDPSFELEINFQGEWLEVLGCGVMEQAILENAGKGDKKAWAFGLGLERLAMVLFNIPDIRLFWTQDQRFLSQFKAGSLKQKFKAYSKFPPCYKDISFWINDEFTENNLCEVVRGIAGDLCEEVKLVDEFHNKKKNLTSNCFRIAYRSMDRSLTDEEINELQARYTSSSASAQVRDTVANKLKVTLR